MKKKTIEFRIACPTWMTNVDVCISNDTKHLNKRNKQASKAVGEKETEKFNGAGRTYQVYIDNEGYRNVTILIRLESLNHGTIAHEIFHCVSYILSFCDLDLYKETEEAYTYTVGYITQCFYDSLPKKIKKGL